MPRVPTAGWVQSSTIATLAPAATAIPVRATTATRAQRLLTKRPFDGWAHRSEEARAWPWRGDSSDVPPFAPHGGTIEADGLEQAEDHAQMFLAQILGAVAGNGDLAAPQYELLVTRLARRGLGEVVTEEPLLELHSGHRAARILARVGPRARCRRPAP